MRDIIIDFQAVSKHVIEKENINHTIYYDIAYRITTNNIVYELYRKVWVFWLNIV